MSKVHATRTYAPLQFEALEPHRFEDLVRDLIYDYRDWQTIEATGRSGGDDGYDIRAFEKRFDRAPSDVDAEAEEDQSLALEGDRWMIQCKREKELGPTRIKMIIEDAVDEDDPPHGYILAAPANFSKRAYDLFRSTLVERGVQEFHLFGRAELEDMLYMPKNDRILFAFFGVSLVSRKRTRVTEIRTTVNNKNKLYVVLGSQNHDAELSAHVLLRDINDTHYPREDKYPAFDKQPRWKEYIACRFYPEGIRFNIREHFAYINQKTKEWDFAPAVDLIYRKPADREEREEAFELRQNIEHFWEHLPRAHQGKYALDGIILYQNFQFIDKQGDALYKFPHLFVDFGNMGPFDGFWEHIRCDHDSWYSVEDYKRVEVFPKKFSKRQFGRIYKDKSILLEAHLVSRLKHNGRTVFFDLNDEYDFLKPTDVIYVAGADDRNSKTYLEVTHRYEIKLAELYEQQPHVQWEIEQARKNVEPDQVVNVLEVKQVYDFQLERK
ncbi:MAG: restriction endonuclease [Candidatus Komeilibacteria bacterium]|nr:restriction endonuclease [Candidatus Komeilibacteria bacterium]